MLGHLSGAMLWVDFTTERGRLVDYTVALFLVSSETTETIRVYDCAHGYNEMHRYSRDEGKQAGTPIHGGSLSQGMRAAISEIEKGYVEMIEGWRGR
jgi:hypothetical protein